MRHVTFLASLLVAAPALAQSGTIMVEQPWARATPGHAGTAAAYLTLTDHGEADTLTGISTPVAGMAMLHEMTMDNGVARMRMLDSVALPPHTSVTFKPGSMHIMLTGLKAPLKAGDSFPITLQFAHAAPVTVTVKVLPAGAAGTAAADHDMGGMKMD